MEKKKQRPGGEEAQQPDRAHAELEPEDVAGHIFAGGVVEVEVDGLAGVVAQVLEPVVAGLPGNGEQGGQKQAPGKEPDQMQQPVSGEGQLVVVVRVAQAEEAQEVLVDEVEVEEAVDVADGGVVADGMALVGIGEAAEDVPGRGDGQKQQRSGDGLQLAPATPLAGEKQVGNAAPTKKTGAMRPLVSRARATRGPHPVKAGGGPVEAGDEAVEGDEQEKAEDGLGNDEAGKEKRADGGEHAQAGIEAGARTPGAARPEPREPGQAEHGQRVGQVGGKGVLAEDAIGRRPPASRAAAASQCSGCR
jgi:hypothetical protein